jgi:hypothetical protein
MAQHLIYHWKHGWIPLTHAAALSKAHGNAKLADKYVPGASAHHASRPTAGKSAREIHGGLEAHTLTRGTAATVHGMNEHGITTSFAGRVTGAPRKVRIKEGPHGKPQEHVAVSMHNGSDNSGNDATAHATMYVPTASPDAGVSDAHRYTPEKGAAAAAALQSAHEARTPSFTPGQKLIASGIGSPGDRPVTYVGLDHNGNHQVRGSVNGRLVTQSVSASAAHKLRPAEAPAPGVGHGLIGEGATVEKDARRTQVGITQGGFRAHGLNPEGRSKQSANGYTEGDRVERKTYDFAKPGHPETWQRGTVEKVTKRDDRLAEVTIRHDDGSAAVELVGPRSGNARVRKVVAGQESGVQGDSRAVAGQQAAHDRLEAAARPSSNVASLAGKRAERAAQTPRQIHDRLQSNPSSVTYDELARLRRLGGRFGAAAEAEQARRNDAAGPRPDVNFNWRTGQMESLTSTPKPATEHRPAAAPARATVDHSGDGTLLSIERSDTAAREAAKAAGFRWSGALGSWYLPRNWSESTRRQKVAQLQQTLGHGTVHLNDSGPGATTTAAEREAAARAHAADRADRMDARAQRASAEADRRFGAAHQISDGIPMGQPILVGHHSQRRHERDIARIHSNMGKGVEAMQEAERAQAAAENARRTVAGDSPLLRLRRIERNQAELRKIDRTLAEHSTAQKIIGGEKYNAASPSARATVDRMLQPSDHHARLTAMRTQLADEIAHDQAQVEASGHKTISAADIKAGDIIHYRGRGHIVKKVNKTTVSVPTGYSWDDKVPVHQIQRHTKVTDMSESTLRAGVDNKTLDPKVRDVYRRELKRRGVTL